MLPVCSFTQSSWEHLSSGQGLNLEHLLLSYLKQILGKQSANRHRIWPCSRLPCLSLHEETVSSPSVRGGSQTWELWLRASAAPLITGMHVHCWSGDRLTWAEGNAWPRKVSRSNVIWKFISAVDSPCPPTLDSLKETWNSDYGPLPESHVLCLGLGWRPIC